MITRVMILSMLPLCIMHYAYCSAPEKYQNTPPIAVRANHKREQKSPPSRLAGYMRKARAVTSPDDIGDVPLDQKTILIFPKEKIVAQYEKRN